MEWDATERAWMLALQAYENRICPLCGMSVDICHDEQQVERLYTQGRVELCFVTQLRNRAILDYEASGRIPTDAKGAATTTLEPRTSLR